MTEMMVQAAAQAVTEVPPTTKVIQIAHVPEGSDRWDPEKRVLVLSGSWNPPHPGHSALLDNAKFDAKVALLSTYNADKPPLVKAQVVDRLRMMELALPDCYVVVTNVPLLIQQAKMLRTMWPSSRLSFAMGWDTWARFNDPQYLGIYHDAAMAEFFRYHRAVVGTRDSLTPAQALMELRDHPYKDSVTVVDNLGFKDMSSTAARMFLAKSVLIPQLDPKVYGYALAAGLYREAGSE